MWQIFGYGGDNLIRFPVSHAYFLLEGDKVYSQTGWGAMAGFPPWIRRLQLLFNTLLFTLNCQEPQFIELKANLLFSFSSQFTLQPTNNNPINYLTYSC